ncbi:unnamed protein product, partial [Protopolystoma xenopodis]
MTTTTADDFGLDSPIVSKPCDLSSHLLYVNKINLFRLAGSEKVVHLTGDNHWTAGLSSSQSMTQSFFHSPAGLQRSLSSATRSDRAASDQSEASSAPGPLSRPSGPSLQREATSSRPEVSIALALGSARRPHNLRRREATVGDDPNRWLVGLHPSGLGDTFHQARSVDVQPATIGSPMMTQSFV